MKKIILGFMLCFFSSLALSKSHVIYLSCPGVDERATDLKVILDQDNGSASLQTNEGGQGLNFTSPASFGPEQVSWRKDFKGYKQTFSVNRSSLKLERKTFSAMTGETYVEKSDCAIVKSAQKNKF
ncbi:MAG: hypothetical protein E6X23_20260 [Mixta calida]|uniref:hypothetical protein n=1 Tax=Mixta calida TaxID=665913 RepID=UPI002910E8DB|nr:hypothetical protein [Mixta calida]MDU4943839.1 hypothetical protein [Mixta calida]